VCWYPPRCGASLRAPRGVVCPPVVGACPVCCPPLRWVLAPCAGTPPRCCGPHRDHCYDCLEATAPHRIHSLAPWRHQESGHPHAYGSCVRRAGTAHAVIHSPQQAFSQQSSGAAASRSRSHSSATNKTHLSEYRWGTGHSRRACWNTGGILGIVDPAVGRVLRHDPRSSGVAPRACVRVYARVLVPPNLHSRIRTYDPPTRGPDAVRGRPDADSRVNPRLTG